MKYLFLILFLLFSIIHLVHSWQDDSQKRAITKPFLLLSLAAYYAFAAETISPVLLLALLTSWLGDVLLIRKGHKWFILGGISFLASHVLFVCVFVPAIQWTAVPWGLIALLAVIYYSISLKIMLALQKSTPKLMLVPMYLYLLANSTMNLFALMRLCTLRTPGSIVSFIGAVLFFISDCTLFLVRYYPKTDAVFKRHFPVMLTYLGGEFLITLGMLIH